MYVYLFYVTLVTQSIFESIEYNKQQDTKAASDIREDIKVKQWYKIGGRAGYFPFLTLPYIT
jgi:hypothetical protein